jgi:hypothetical protein
MIYIGLIVALALSILYVRNKGKEERMLVDGLHASGFVIDEVYRMSSSTLYVDRANRHLAIYNCSGYIDSPVEKCRYPLSDRSFKHNYLKFPFEDISKVVIKEVSDPKYPHISIKFNTKKSFCAPRGFDMEPICSSCHTVITAGAHVLMLPRLTSLFKDDLQQEIKFTKGTLYSYP